MAAEGFRRFLGLQEKTELPKLSELAAGAIDHPTTPPRPFAPAERPARPGVSSTHKPEPKAREIGSADKKGPLATPKHSGVLDPRAWRSRASRATRSHAVDFARTRF